MFVTFQQKGKLFLGGKRRPKGRGWMETKLQTNEIFSLKNVRRNQAHYPQFRETVILAHKHLMITKPYDNQNGWML